VHVNKTVEALVTSMFCHVTFYKYSMTSDACSMEIYVVITVRLRLHVLAYSSPPRESHKHRIPG
jgi:hypothetical protein